MPKARRSRTSSWPPRPANKGPLLKNLRTLSYIRELGAALSGLENPVRYLGGEFGAKRPLPVGKDLETTLLSAICFPDIYEIGMSNTALKLIYQMLPPEKGQWCGRSFVPDPDMEALMREHHLPLVTLEEGVVLSDLDVLGITIGFELSATNILTLLDLGGITLEAANRGPDEPVVIGGGPALTNPLPFGTFLDACVVGEAEACLPELMEELRQLKIAGWDRAKALDILEASPHVWMPRKKTAVRRAAWNGFASEDRKTAFPVPSLKVIQDYGSLEIMRGCPQGCRFCHAGVFYRPYRQKAPALIMKEAARLVSENGYRDISLASLSSGDYPGIQKLYEDLNKTFSGIGISFALPSLKVNSFTLPLLEEMSKVKKSGLTFAVETPTEEGQRALNKTVGIEATLNIMREAKSLGWKGAKLYFMTGLPFGSPEEDCEGIRALVTDIRRQVGINLNISIGTFVPKPHTPYQWAAQAEPERVFRAFMTLKNSLRPLGVQVAFQRTFSSFLEGIIARGDETTGRIILSAWQKGARFDAWDDRLNKHAWDAALDEAGPGPRERLLCGYSTDEELPWGKISMGLAGGHLKREYQRSCEAVLTPRCLPDCKESCGVCSKNITVVHEDAPAPDAPLPDPASLFRPGWEGPVFASPSGTEVEVAGMLFAFTKLGSQAFLPHLSLAQVLERSMVRAGIPFRLSPGFSPHPVMELGQALSLGIPSLNEWAMIQLGRPMDGREFMDKLNPCLPDGILVHQALPIRALKEGRRCPSLGSLLDQGSYLVRLSPQLLESGAPALLLQRGEALSGREAARILVKGLMEELGLPDSTREALNLLDTHFPGEPEGGTWYRIRLDKEKPTLRSLLSEPLGKDWQTWGIASLRLALEGEKGRPAEAFRDWLQEVQ